MINPWKALSQVNPQRENGHRRINSDVWQALVSAGLPGSVYQVVMYVIDRSWGYDQIEVSLGYSQLCKATRLTKPSVINAVKIAEKTHLLVIEHGNTLTQSTNVYLFNKYYDTWLTSKANSTSKINSTSTSKVNSTSTSKAPTSKVSFLTENRKQKGYIYTDNKNKNKSTENRDPDKYIKGKYGHMVER